MSLHYPLNFYRNALRSCLLVFWNAQFQHAILQLRLDVARIELAAQRKAAPVARDAYLRVCRL